MLPLLFIVFVSVQQSNASSFHPQLMQSPETVELELKFNDCLMERQHFPEHKLDDFDYLPVWSIYAMMATCSTLCILCLFTLTIFTIKSFCCSRKRAVRKNTIQKRHIRNHDDQVRISLGSNGKINPVHEWRSTTITVKGNEKQNQNGLILEEEERKLSDELFDYAQSAAREGCMKLFHEGIATV